jgi:hypothetical protein
MCVGPGSFTGEFGTLDDFSNFSTTLRDYAPGFCGQHDFGVE